MNRPFAARPASFAPTDHEGEARGRRGNRRRLTVFLIVFVTLSILGLAWDYSRPAVYRATARLTFVPMTAAKGEATASASATSTDSDGRFLLRDEIQYLTSRTLLATAWQRLQDSTALRPAGIDADPAATLQQMLAVRQVEGTNAVLLVASGGEPAFLAAFLDRLIASYRDSLSERYRSASADTLADVGDEARKLEASVVAKRKELDAFRTRYNIVSGEREDNQTLSEVRATTTALNLANDKVVAAETKLATLQAAQAAGQAATRERDNGTLAALEQQAINIRAELREVARTFTPQYMQIDPRVRALRERLAELEQQIVAQRQSSQTGALQEAQEQVTTTRAAVAALRRQLGSGQQTVQAFTSRFNEYNAMQEELKRMEVLRQRAIERQTGLQAAEDARKPKLELIEPADVPASPSSPLYLRDAALALVAALLAGLLTMGIVEFFNRPPRQPPSVIVQQSWSPIAVGAGGGLAALGGADPTLLADAPTAMLAAPSSLPRELTGDELAALLDAASPGLRAAMALLLVGLGGAEVVGLRRGDVDRTTGTLRAGGPPGRPVSVPANIVALLPAVPGADDAPLLKTRNGQAMTESDLDAALLYAAHDAGLEAPDEITSAVLHHTCVAFLVRQGTRFSDLVALVGDIPSSALADYRRLVPLGTRRSLDEVDPVLPALRAL